MRCIKCWEDIDWKDQDNMSSSPWRPICEDCYDM